MYTTTNNLLQYEFKNQELEDFFKKKRGWVREWKSIRCVSTTSLIRSQEVLTRNLRSNKLERNEESGRMRHRITLKWCGQELWKNYQTSKLTFLSGITT